MCWKIHRVYSLSSLSKQHPNIPPYCIKSNTMVYPSSEKAMSCTRFPGPLRWRNRISLRTSSEKLHLTIRTSNIGKLQVKKPKAKVLSNFAAIGWGLESTKTLKPKDRWLEGRGRESFGKTHSAFSLLTTQGKHNLTLKGRKFQKWYLTGKESYSILAFSYSILRCNQ